MAKISLSISCGRETPLKLSSSPRLIRSRYCLFKATFNFSSMSMGRICLNCVLITSIAQSRPYLFNFFCQLQFPRTNLEQQKLPDLFLVNKVCQINPLPFPIRGRKHKRHLRSLCSAHCSRLTQLCQRKEDFLEPLIEAEKESSTETARGKIWRSDNRKWVTFAK